MPAWKPTPKHALAFHGAYRTEEVLSRPIMPGQAAGGPEPDLRRSTYRRYDYDDTPGFGAVFRSVWHPAVSSTPAAPAAADVFTAAEMEARIAAYAERVHARCGVFDGEPAVDAGLVKRGRCDGCGLRRPGYSPYACRGWVVERVFGAWGGDTSKNNVITLCPRCAAVEHEARFRAV